MSNWISIDFGTSYSVASLIRNGQPELVGAADGDVYGSRLFPVIAYVDGEDRVLACGDAARLVGKGAEAWRFVRDFKDALHPGAPDGLKVSYVHIVAEVLKTIKKAAESALDDIVENVVLTVPAAWHNADEKSRVMKKAAGANGAGFKRIEFLKEPQAATIYCDFVEEKTEKLTLVYDLGALTFDAAIVEYTEETGYRLLKHNAGLRTGGDFFTEKILYDFLAKTGKTQEEASEADWKRCEDIKIQLSVSEKLPDIGGENYKLARSDFEAMISGYIDETVSSCNSLIDEAGIEWKDLDRVLLIGGSCHVPLVRKKIENHLAGLNAEKTRIVFNKRAENGKVVSPHFSVVFGAAVHAIKNLVAPPPPPITIATLKNIQTGETCQLAEGENIFGRQANAGCNFIFPNDAKMSRIHFSITVTKSEAGYDYLITDLKSSNGTQVDSMVLSNEYAFDRQSVALKSGERIVAGNTKFEFVV